MPNQKFQIDIHARDRTREGIESATRGFSKLAKDTPLQPLNRHLREVREKFEGLRDVTKVFRSMGDAGSVASGGIGEAAGGMAMLGEAAGVAGLATVGVGAALIGVGDAAIKLGDGISLSGAKTGRFAQAIGLSTKELQAFEIAGKSAGVTTDAMDSSLQNVGNTLQDMATDRGNAANTKALWTALGLGEIPRLANGSIDAGKAMLMLAGAMNKGNAETKQMIVSTFGVSGALSFMLQSQREINRSLEEGRNSVANLSDEQIRDYIKMQSSITKLEDNWHGLMGVLASKLVVPWLQPTLDGLNKLEDLAASALQGKLGKSSTAQNHVGKSEKDWQHASVRAGMNLFEDAENGVLGLFGMKAKKYPPGGGHSPPLGHTSGDLDAMARAIYTEAASESPVGQAAVAHVILNRVREHFGGAKSISDVVNAPLQFEGMTTSRRNVSTSDPGYKRALAIAEAVMAGKIADPTGGADHYLNPDLQANLGRNQPSWAPGGGRRIGRHVFYGGAATDIADPQGSGVQLADAGKAANGSVQVDVTLRGAPPGTIASVSSRGQGISAGVKIAPAMQGAA